MNGIVGGENNTTLDLTSDGIVDDADLSVWLTDAATANGFAAPYLLGDANLARRAIDVAFRNGDSTASIGNLRALLGTQSVVDRT